MGFDLFGQAPKADSGFHFYNNVWGWRPIQALIAQTCQDILTEEELLGLRFNNGHAYSADKALAIARRLSDIAADEKQFAQYGEIVMAQLSENYEGCWSKENVLAFVEFLDNAGGFEVC